MPKKVPKKGPGIGYGSIPDECFYYLQYKVVGPPLADTQLQNFYASIDTASTICSSNDFEHAKETITFPKVPSAAQ
ncbi:hypothetical protein GGU45_004057 [Niabella hirudinis]